MTENDEALEFPFEQRCASLFRGLRGINEFHVSKAEFGRLSKLMRDPEKVFASLAEDDDLPLSPRVQEYYFRHKEISLSWRPVDEDSEMIAEFHLSHVMRAVAQNHLGDIWEGDDDSQRALHEELRVFDDTPRTGTGRMAALRASRGATDPEIWYFDMREGAMPMELDYAGYLDTLLITKGVIGWQYLYCEPEYSGLGFIPLADGLKDMLEIFPRLFPEHDYTDLRARLEART
ncbi:hypothetical protein [Streptomyces massasporeus]|uniref:hypothetical protein n=1 Tax=Streptomyces massasporeus TaxID=67324 RepID=UPI003818BA24